MTPLIIVLLLWLAGVTLILHGHLKKSSGRFSFKLSLPERKNIMLELSLTNEQKIKVSLTPTTAVGKPAKVDGVPTWTVESGSATLAVADDGLSAYIISPDDPGESMVIVKADADLGSGIEEISDAIKLTVSGAKAISLGLAAGDPEPK